MPFTTPEGPAILLENICDAPKLAERLGVHVNSVYQWVRTPKTEFPTPIIRGSQNFYDYEEVYDWFRDWVREHPWYYPNALSTMEHSA